MNADEVVTFLKGFNWRLIQGLHGCAHSSLIGFISHRWLELDPLRHTVLDGAPASKAGKERTGQRNADLMLCENGRPFCVVEVEDGIRKYGTKVKTILTYLDGNRNSSVPQFGLLIMENSYGSTRKRSEHNWGEIELRDGLLRAKRRLGQGILLAAVSCRKEPQSLPPSRCKVGDWRFVEVRYRVYSCSGRNLREGLLWGCGA